MKPARIKELREYLIQECQAKEMLDEIVRLRGALFESAIALESIHNDRAPLAPGCFNDYHFGGLVIRVGCHPGTDEEAPCLFAEDVTP